MRKGEIQIQILDGYYMMGYCDCGYAGHLRLKMYLTSGDVWMARENVYKIS
jgi:hypothetical protein